MEEKKTKEKNLENKRFIFLELGLVISLVITFLAFEWKVDIQDIDGFRTLDDEFVDEIIIPITRPQANIQPPPPPAVDLSDILNIVNNDDEIEIELQIEDAEANPIENIIIDVTEDTEYGDEDRIFIRVEQMPSFPGGLKALAKFISKTVRYPVVAQENDIYGTVYIGFVIDKDGSITNVKVLRSVDHSLDKEAVRVIKMMPRWKPGKQRNKTVKVSYTVPINFRLK